jgi:integrase
MHPAQRSLLLTETLDLDAILQSEKRIGRAQKAPNTREAYFFAWRAFTLWCRAACAPPLPADPNGENYSCKIHTQALMFAQLGLNRFPDTAAGKRNRAMVLVAFAAGWRRSEVTRLWFSDLRFAPQGIELFLRASKTDQMAEGRIVGIQPGDNPATCPIAALKVWLAVRGTWEGPLFPRITPRQEVSRDPLGRRAEAMHIALRRALQAIGEDPKFFGAHSLRAGMVTEAAKNGASEAAIMQRTGHKCSATLRRYIRPATAFDFNPLKGVL